MGKFPDFRRLMREDMAGSPDWIDRMILPINMFFDQANKLFRNLTIGDNVVGQWFPVTFSTPSDYATGGFNIITLTWPYPNAVNGMYVGMIREQVGNNPLVTSTITVSDWLNLTGNQLQIRYITGLAASKNYTGTVLVL
jgi:hypothetical protein